MQWVQLERKAPWGCHPGVMLVRLPWLSIQLNMSATEVSAEDSSYPIDGDCSVYERPSLEPVVNASSTDLK